jgi:hypothetical protein
MKTTRLGLPAAAADGVAAASRGVESEGFEHPHITAMTQAMSDADRITCMRSAPNTRVKEKGFVSRL